MKKIRKPFYYKSRSSERLLRKILQWIWDTLMKLGKSIHKKCAAFHLHPSVGYVLEIVLIIVVCLPTLICALLWRLTKKFS